MSTFGDTGTTGAYSGQSSGNIVVCKFPLSEAASVTKLTAEITGAASAGSQVLRGLIYADAAGVPGALKGAIGTEVSFTSTVSNVAAVDLPFSSPIALAAGNYWLGMMWGAANLFAGLTQVAGVANQVKFINTGLTYPTPPDPFGTPSGSLAWIVRVFATYTPTSTTASQISLASPAGPFLKMKGLR